jgi:probable F420-dependent oxidoreductase
MKPRLVVALSNYGDYFPDGEWRRLVDVAAAAETAGVDAITVYDHLVLGGDLDKYPYGTFPGSPDGNWLEPLTVLAALAGGTERIVLTTGVMIAPLRSPVLLAKTAATLDQLSGGRLELGVGMGWLDREYEAVGLDFSKRGRLFDDALAVCRSLWEGGPTSFASERLTFDDIYCSPRPVQKDGVPFMVGGALSARNTARLVRHGAGWITPLPASFEEIAEGTALLRERFADAGRDPDSLRVRIAVNPADGRPDPARTFAGLAEIVAATGATEVLTSHEAYGRDPDEAAEFFEELVGCFAAALAA